MKPTTPSLHHAAEGDDFETVDRLLAAGAKVDGRDGDGNTALRLTRHPRIAKALLAHGADLHTKNSDGLSPIHRAADTQAGELLHLYIDLGANVNAKSGKGFTPLHVAVWRGSEYNVALLLTKGADPAAVTSDGRSAILDRRVEVLQPALIAVAALNKLVEDSGFSAKGKEIRESVVRMIHEHVIDGYEPPHGFKTAGMHDNLSIVAAAADLHESRVLQRALQLRQVLQGSISEMMGADVALRSRMNDIWKQVQERPLILPATEPEMPTPQSTQATRRPWWKVW